MRPPDPMSPDVEPARWGLFLDVDGTLLTVRERPSSVRLDVAVREALAAVIALNRGALALVSGRNLEDLDRIFDPLKLPAAGLHGLERRRSDGEVIYAAAAPALDPTRAAMKAFAATHDRLLLEDKQRSLALHYRQAPELAEEVRQLAHSLAKASGDELIAVHGKMVVELKPAYPNKGSAIADFLSEAPFAGRLPVFLGDDVTDEDGFKLVNERGGVSVRVGEGESAARYRLPDEAAVADWLFRLKRSLLDEAGAAQ